MAKLSYKERARLRREQEILRTAARMIRDNGYANLNMDDLADEVGISKPTLYQHFKGKDDMVAKAMLKSMEDMEAHVIDVEGERAIDKLENIMRYMLASHADPDGVSVAIVSDPNIALHHLMNEASEMREIQLRVSRKIYELVDYAKKEGDVRDDMPNVIVVGAMFSAMSILRGPAIVNDRSTPVETIIDSVVAYFRRGVAP